MVLGKDWEQGNGAKAWDEQIGVWMEVGGWRFGGLEGLIGKEEFRDRKNWG